MSNNKDFDLFTTSKDHEELRAAVRAVAEDKIAPMLRRLTRRRRCVGDLHRD